MTTTTVVIPLQFPERVEITRRTIDTILDHLADCVAESNRSTDDASIHNKKFVFYFTKIAGLDSNVTPDIRKFAREHNVRSVHISNTRHDVCRKILTTMGGFFNLESIVLDSSCPGEAEICLPLVLRKTVSAITELTFANMSLNVAVLQEWASVFGGARYRPPMTSLIFKNVVFDDTYNSIKFLGNILKSLCQLREFRFESNFFGATSHQQENMMMFGPFAKGLSKLPNLQKLALTNFNIEGSDVGLEEFLAPDSLVRKSLVELSMLDCNLSLSTVRFLSFLPGQFEKLETIDVSRNPMLTVTDVAKLEQKFKNVFHDFCTDSSHDENDLRSDDDSATEVDTSSDDSEGGVQDEPWDFTQLDTLHLNDMDFGGQ